MKTLLNAILLSIIAMLIVTPAQAQSYRGKHRPAYRHHDSGAKVAIGLGAAALGIVVGTQLARRPSRIYPPVAGYAPAMPTYSNYGSGYRPYPSGQGYPAYAPSGMAYSSYGAAHPRPQPTNRSSARDRYLEIANDCAHQVPGACEALDYLDHPRR